MLTHQFQRKLRDMC